MEATSGSAGTGARIHHEYHDRIEDTVAVTRDDLREISTVGWLQEGAAGIGMFFLSGAFWLLITLIAEHGRNSDFYPWYLACLVIIACGAAVTSIGLVLLRTKRRRLHKYFDRENVR